MATRKQIEESFRRSMSLVHKLSKELIQAERKGLMEKTDNDKYSEESPLAPLWEMQDKVRQKYRGPIADAVMHDLEYGKASKRRR